MKEVIHKGRTIHIEQNEEKEITFVPKISSVFNIDKRNPFLPGLGIDARHFKEDEIAMFEIADAANVVDVLADGISCNRVVKTFTFPLKGKDEVYLQIICDKIYHYEFTFRDPYVDCRKGNAFAGETVEFVVLGRTVPPIFTALRCTNKATGEETILPLTPVPFPPNCFSFVMPPYDMTLSLVEDK